MRVNVAIPEAHVKEPVLNAALEAVTRLNEELIKTGDSPTFRQAVANGVRWKPEPPGAEHFDHGGIVSDRGWGDCDDLAPLHAASLRTSGEDRGAHAIVVPSGPQRWHAVVKRSNGKIDDPSAEAGMNSGHGISGAVLPLMCPPASVSGAYYVRPQLALRPVDAGWGARVDIPWHWQQQRQGDPSPADIAMTALHQHPVAANAIVGALDGAVLLGEASGIADPDHLERLRAMADYASGMPLHELAGEYGHEHAKAAYHVIGSFWSHLSHALSPLAKAVTSPVTSAVHFAQHPSLSNLTHLVTNPLNAALHAAQPLAHAVQPFSGLVRMVPGIGPVAMSAVDLVNHGLPTSLADAARFAARQGAGMIPGVSQLQQMAAPSGAWPGFAAFQ
jgi:hypothetical protein